MGIRTVVRRSALGALLALVSIACWQPIPAETDKVTRGSVPTEIDDTAEQVQLPVPVNV